MIELVGAAGYGVTVGWATAFAGGTERAVAWRLAAGIVAAGSAWLIADAIAATAALAGVAAGGIGHELFIWQLKRGKIG